ncbi:MAG: GGDEF domain-containing protein [Maledivibacter sp.]|jgi:diguanylate cyclase (GGDEF)-like protein|nr:GGDEF domain-containing protein [Maledivibacter sp.]
MESVLWIFNIILIITMTRFIILSHRLKKENKELKRYKIIKEIMEVSSREKNILKVLKDINTILIKELQMDYSSFFFINQNTKDLVLKETNIADNNLARQLANIKDHKMEFDSSQMDFIEMLKNNSRIAFEDDMYLDYPTAKNRSVKSTYIFPLLSSGEVIAYWLIENCSINKIDEAQIIILADQIANIINSGLYAYLDPLMQIPKRDFLIEYIDDNLNNENYPMTIVYADIDNFSNINNNHGHDIGDEVLKIVSNIFSKNIRHADMVARQGGEEIVFCIPRMNKELVIERIENIRKELESIEIEIEEKIIKVTSSFGLVTYPNDFANEDINPQKLIKKADDLLYVAKKEGKNRVAYI